MKQGVAILDIFVADLAFRSARQPLMGETILGTGFKMGPGGKGSNQAVAAAGAKVSFISRLGRDAFVGAFAAALSDGKSAADAARFGCAAAGISVTRQGTAPAMPSHQEIEDILRRG